ncbi:MAG: rsmG [Cypionkella sp.]|uniref:16S rRNA (guanine(527)-N(7))-methyltransferase RsmG n=1 Tax=Cypionkella sp. TaxID=2811411 RepID=UPI0026178C9F|nr:16S rRNA (guanine(527)-N(7))-methyltransferase RsmG [Cypionkella sp.]MDB5658587.1 rsmG [Cypionkella sp.]
MRFENEVLPGWLNVSRETFSKLVEFSNLVEKWNPAINLVSKGGVADLWQRHVIDSAQLVFHIPEDAALYCDLGSGGGFPGIIMAVLAEEFVPEMHVVLVESDRRKSVFLAEAARHLGISPVIKTERIQDLAPQNADVLTARALAPFSELCGLASRHLRSSGLALFPKGANAQQELQVAQVGWLFDHTEIPSRTNPDAVIFSVRNIRHA